MSVDNRLIQLPAFNAFNDSIAALSLPISCSELHGLMCGYLCAGAFQEGEAWLRALMVNQKDEATRQAALAMFHVFALSQQQIVTLDFEFKLLLPDDDEPLIDRARAFSEWCEGFTQGLTVSGVDAESFDEEEVQDAFQHISEFAELDCDTLDIDEQDDEKALMEVSEYTRMAVLRLYSDLHSSEERQDKDFH